MFHKPLPICELIRRFRPLITDCHEHDKQFILANLTADWITLTELTIKLGISRSRIQKALHGLCYHGLVDRSVEANSDRKIYNGKSLRYIYRSKQDVHTRNSTQRQQH